MQELARYESETTPPADLSQKETVRFLFDEIQRRAYHSTKGLTAEQVNHTPAPGSWCIGEILGHQLRLVAFFTNFVRPGTLVPPAPESLGEPGRWELEAILEIRERQNEAFRRVWSEVGEAELLGKRPDMPPPAWAEWTVIQRLLRPLTDLSTHVGQVNYIRRLLGNPVGRY